jgi:hypothetical protein
MVIESFLVLATRITISIYSKTVSLFDMESQRIILVVGIFGLLVDSFGLCHRDMHPNLTDQGSIFSARS